MDMWTNGPSMKHVLCMKAIYEVDGYILISRVLEDLKMLGLINFLS